MSSDDSEEIWLLEKLPGKSTPPFLPGKLILLITLEIVIKDSSGEYLLLTHHSYDLDHKISDPYDEGFWAPPFWSKDLEGRLPDSNEGIIKCFDDAMSSESIMEKVDQLRHSLGFPEVKSYQPTGVFTEIRRSPRNPDQFNAYRIIRCTVTDLGPRGIRNISDPECWKGHVFLPLNRTEDVIFTRFSEKHKVMQWCFLSKPLSTNTKYILETSEMRDLLKQHAITIDDKEFFRDESAGLIVMVDLAGFGSANKFAVEQMGDFDEEGPEVASEYRKKVTRIFYNFLTEVGISAVHLAGDGFIAALPERHYKNRDGGLEASVRTLTSAYTDLVVGIERLNTYIWDTSKRVGSRMALHFGEYRYGRIAGPASYSADFEGTAIIEVARAEKALSAITKGEATGLLAQAIEALDQNGLLHTVICTPEFTKMAGSYLDTAVFRLLGSLAHPVKESTISGTVYAANPLMMSTR